MNFLSITNLHIDGRYDGFTTTDEIFHQTPRWRQVQREQRPTFAYNCIDHILEFSKNEKDESWI